MPSEKTGAGAATAAGIAFQENVAAWLVCQILAGPNRTNDLELPPDALLETITCESLEPIDDIVVRASDRTLYFQCKTTLSIGANDEFVKVIQQFAEQFLKPGCSDDRYVLAVSDTASAVLRTSLRAAMKSSRGTRGPANPGAVPARIESSFHAYPHACGEFANKVLAHPASFSHVQGIGAGFKPFRGAPSASR